jgi:hypothetical protein
VKLHARQWLPATLVFTGIMAWPAARLIAGPAAVPSRQENQLWYDGQYALPVGHGLDLIGSGGARLGRGLNHLVYARAGVFVALKLLPILTVAPSYNYVVSRPVAGKDTREHRYAIDATLGRRCYGFEINDRNRIERRVLPTTAYFRYMNRLQIQHPLHVHELQFNLWIADEVFYYGSLKAWPRNRFSAGVSKRMSRDVALDFFYLRQNDSHSYPGDINTFGVSIKKLAKR